MVTNVFISLLVLIYYCHFYKTVTSDKPLQASLLSGAAELITHLSRLINILWLPLCRINKFGFYFPRRLLRSPILVGHQDYFLAPLPGSIALFVSQSESDIVLFRSFTVGKTHEKFPILPSTTRKGTTLNTSAALDSPSVLSKLLTPPHTHVTHTATSVESENTFQNLDDASAVLDKSGSLGPFLETKIARAKQIENTVTPVSSPEPRGSPNDDLDETYIDLDQLDDDFIDECHATIDASVVRNLLAKRAVR